MDLAGLTTRVSELFETMEMSAKTPIDSTVCIFLVVVFVICFVILCACRPKGNIFF